MPSLTISIVNYNCSDETIAAVCSIKKFTDQPDYLIYVIDNASTEQEAQKLKAIEAEDVVVIYNKENIGFGLAHNIAIEQSQAAYHAVVNPDIILFEDSMSLLIAGMEKEEKTVMATCRLRFKNGQEQFTPKLSPTPLSLVARQLGIFKAVEDRYLMLDKDLTKPQDITFCTGCFFIARTESLKAVGGFSDRYFLYFEDADLTRIMMKQGDIRYLPVTTVEHLWQRKPRKSVRFFCMQLFSMFTYFTRWGIIRPRIDKKTGGIAE